MVGLVEKLEHCSRPLLMGAGLVLLALIGFIDYLTGFELTFSVFYLLEVGLAAWFVGRSFGFVMSVLSVAVSIGGDVAAGAHYSRTPLIPIWNALILLVFYLVVVQLLASLRSLHRELGARVEQR